MASEIERQHLISLILVLGLLFIINFVTLIMTALIFQGTKVTCIQAKAVSSVPAYPGELHLLQLTKGIQVVGCLTGFVPNSTHGFHVHEFGLTSNDCQDAGPHYNPLNMLHGGIQSPTRHIGDLGNLQADAHGILCTNKYYPETDLTGKNGVLGRTLVIHEKEDDLGTAGTADSQATGSSGKRLTCAVISPI